MVALSAQQIREKILGAEDLQQEQVVVPEWHITKKDKVFVRELTGSQRDQYEGSVVKATAEGKVTINQVDMRAKLVAMSLVTAEGKPVFAPEDVKALGAKSATALDRVTDIATRLSGIGAEEVEQLGKD